MLRSSMWVFGAPADFSLSWFLDAGVLNPVLGVWGQSPKVRRTSEVRRTCRGGSYPQGLTDGLKRDRQRNSA
jgi:hypothetical protein